MKYYSIKIYIFCLSSKKCYVTLHRNQSFYIFDNLKLKSFTLNLQNGSIL